MTPVKFRKPRSPVWTDSRLEVREWYASALGQSILDELGPHLDVVLPGIFGYQGLQIGDLTPEFPVLERAGIHRALKLDAPTISADIQADVLNLPIASDVMKLVVLPHTLDFCHQPHQALRETDRVLSDDGQIVIIGFNPFSQMGIGHAMLGWRSLPPWSGQFFSRRRVTEWLSVLNYRLLDSQCVYVRPPIDSVSFQHRLRPLERFRPWLGAVGSVYVLHARKQTFPMTPARRQWRRKTTGITVGSFAKSSDVLKKNREE